MIAWLVITDGRDDYLADAVASGREQLRGQVTERWMYDDTGDVTHRDWLAAQYPDFEIIHAYTRQGFGGAIRAAWKTLHDLSVARFVFHHEGDFTFNRPVPLDDLAVVLDMRPQLVQLALRRQPWNDAERAAGGIVEQHPADYRSRTDGVHSWLEHRRFFTANPSLYRRTLCDRGWPSGNESEGRFGLRLFAEQPAAHCGFWGARSSGEWVTHIGHERAGTGY